MRGVELRITASRRITLLLSSKRQNRAELRRMNRRVFLKRGTGYAPLGEFASSQLTLGEPAQHEGPFLGDSSFPAL